MTDPKRVEAAGAREAAIDVVGEEAAFCGLSPADVKNLAVRVPMVHLVVRFRSARGDGRCVMSAAELVALSRQGLPVLVGIGAVPFSYEDVRDVFLASLR